MDKMDKKLKGPTPIDLSTFLYEKENGDQICRKVVENLHKYGILVVKDPRVDFKKNQAFIEMLEKYFGKPTDVKMKDAHPEIFYQLGVTPHFVEKARARCQEMKVFDKKNMPLTLCPPEKDPKWRYFWRIGPRPEKTEFAQLNASPVIPEDFPEWAEIMDNWGDRLLETAKTVAKMAAVGFGMDENVFSDFMEFGPHLLAPTGSDLAENGEKGTVFAGFHQDLNFLTVHGKSNYPGLFVWLRTNEKIAVEVPEGCLLVQAGMQFERLTGGHVLAGFHEVVVSDETLEKMRERKKQGKSLWRVSSTLFAHIASDNYLEPLHPFPNDKKYPRVKAGAQVLEELNAIINN
ncbi:hypothetical protein MHBO_003631 [Bonamia ostreae]|uniref:Non-haem dioxygenase N-terminal domain-containing protein n=1 Tax=Bonamia ostreae TaxID=126728 RepID=A0ABV2AR20_9EUKA